MVLKIDLHTHTNYSYDGWTSVSRLIKAARGAGLDRVCVTDHGTMRGALEARDAAPDLIIPGIEIRCAGGTELIGIWVDEPIQDGLSPQETAAAIRALGGFVYAPHPYAYPTRSRWHAARAIEVADVVEVYNGRAFLAPWNRRAKSAAHARGMPAAASSDAHFPWEVGRGFTEVQSFTTSAELLEALGSGRPAAAATPTFSGHLLSAGLGAARKIFPRGG